MSVPPKIVLLGESGVGKTCIIKQFVEGSFDEGTLSSLTNQFVIKTLEFPGGKSLTLHVWDTAGQEKYRSLAKIYYKDAKAVILVYDITDEKSFNEIKNYWYEQVKESGASNPILGVAANKSDIYDERKVNDEDGKGFAKQIGAVFSATSAKTSEGINILFENIALKILDPNYDFYKKKAGNVNPQENKNDNPPANKGVQLTKEKTIKEKKTGCC